VACLLDIQLRFWYLQHTIKGVLIKYSKRHLVWLRQVNIKQGGAIMKISKVGLSLMVVVFIAFLSFSTAHAQEMGIWEGKWFKCTTKYSGYDTNESEATSRHSATEVNYNKILNVDETNKVLKSLNYSYEDGQWQSESESWDLHYTGGNRLDFLCYYFAEELPYGYYFGFTGRIQGKMKGTILKSATIKSLGGFEWDGGYSASGVTVSCSLIPESKLPPDIPK